MSDQSKREVKPFNFKGSVQVPQTQIQGIQGIYEVYAGKIASSLSKSYRVNITASVLSLNQSNFGEFRETVQSPSIMGIIDMSPMRGEAMIEVSPNLVFNFIDRMLGGRGELISLTRPLTDIEMKLVEEILRGFTNDLKNSLTGIVTTNARLTNVLTNPRFIQIASNSDICISGSIEIKVGEITGIINICAPSVIIDAIMEGLSGEKSTSGKRKSIQNLITTPDDQVKTKELMKDVKFPFVVTLGQIDSKASDVMNLQVGDVIRLQTKITDHLTATVGDVPKYKCKPGQIGSNLAVEIIKMLKKQPPMDDAWM
ncbi:FliM/FliN family flagellar motor switch protein [bacterium]|nr:FliM/FliN family flagellar motor switch protein [bacterium]MBU1754230.1 FliM/FliN family flagellar motor switch protein [bacterium]